MREKETRPFGAGSAGEPATTLIAALAIEIDTILSHFRLRQDEAEDLLREILLLAIHRWDAIDSREIWLLATLRRACLARLDRRVQR